MMLANSLLLFLEIEFIGVTHFRFIILTDGFLNREN